MKEWIEGTPPSNIFYRVWWVTDGEQVFLANWENDTWVEVHSHFFQFIPESITHYRKLDTPKLFKKKEIQYAKS